MYLQNKYTFKERQIAQVVDLFNYYNIKIETEPYDYFLIYYNAFESSWKVYDDVFPALSKISFLKMGIISNGDDLQQRKKLERLGINKYFNDVITSGKFGISKPSRRIFDVACERNNVKPEECYYIGDKIKTDMLPLKQIGIKGILIDRERIAKKSVDYDVINSLFELEKILFR